MAALREELVAELRPVHPLDPRRLGILVVVLCFGVELALLWPLLGLRPDAEVLGARWLWGPTLLSLAMGAVLVSLALRSVMPGQLPSPPTLLVWPVLGIGLHGVTYLALHARSPVVLPPGHEVRAGLLCFGMELALGAPFVVLLVLLARRGLAASPLPPVAVGALGVAIVTDTVRRLLCPLSAPLHVATSHLAGVAAVVLVGVALAVRWDRDQLRQWRSRVLS